MGERYNVKSGRENMWLRKETEILKINQSINNSHITLKLKSEWFNLKIAGNFSTSFVWLYPQLSLNKYFINVSTSKKIKLHVPCLKTRWAGTPRSNETFHTSDPSTLSWSGGRTLSSLLLHRLPPHPQKSPVWDDTVHRQDIHFIEDLRLKLIRR